MILKELNFEGHLFMVTFDYSDTNYGVHVHPMTEDAKNWFENDENAERLNNKLNKEF